MLSTIDNPFDPFEQFNDWLNYDTSKGYYSSNVLARIAQIEEDFTQNEIEEENERAIDEIIKHDPLNIFCKVTKQTVDEEKA